MQMLTPLSEAATITNHAQHQSRTDFPISGSDFFCSPCSQANPGWLATHF